MGEARRIRMAARKRGQVAPPVRGPVNMVQLTVLVPAPLVAEVDERFDARAKAAELTRNDFIEALLMAGLHEFDRQLAARMAEKQAMQQTPADIEFNKQLVERLSEPPPIELPPHTEEGGEA